MNKSNFKSVIDKLFSSSKVNNIVILCGFVLLFTLALSSKYFFFQSIINAESISKMDVTAPKTIEVIDKFKTEQRKKELAQKVDPILAPSEDTYIKNNLNNLLSNILLIRDKNIDKELKITQLNSMFDVSDAERTKTLINFYLNADDSAIEVLSAKAKRTLDSVLKTGITEKDFEKNNIFKIIMNNVDYNTTKTQINIIMVLIEQVIIPNMVLDENATETARQNAMDSVPPIVVKFDKGEKIVSEGEPITQLKRDALNKAGYNTLQLNFQGFIGILTLVSIAVFSVIYYLKYFEKQFLEYRYLFIMSLLVLIITSFAIILPNNWSVFLLPFPVILMILAVFTNPRTAFVVTIALLATISIALQFSSMALAIFILVSMVAMVNISRVRYSRRFDLIKIGFEIAAVMLVSIACIYLLELCIMDVDTKIILRDLQSGLFNGIISGMLAIGILPVIEGIFGITSSYGLAELADHNQPLLKRLQFEAPGTFSHSLMVSNLAEAASEAIGADPMLARVGALYHDIGKIKRPLFFIENQTYYGIDNPHTKLNPRLSKMVITAHPKDGIDLAQEYNLPSVIQNFIMQHHGDSLTSYFYNQAIQQEGEENVKEEQFRYVGPKPASKESAIIMIADAVESASRTLKTHSQEEIETVIDKIISDRLQDGQLSESPLTLKDIKVIASTFSRILRAAHHQRIKYHENIVEELENKVKNKSLLTSKITDTELEEKIEKKIQKRQQKYSSDNNPDNKDENN